MTAKNAAANRPLSPFMIGPYYRPQFTSMLSITHRMTGLALTLGTLALALWLMCAAAGPDAYARYQWFIGGIGGKLLMVAYTWAIMYHLSNGIRHLVWDTGTGFTLPAVRRSAYIVLSSSVILTVLVWVLALV